MLLHLKGYISSRILNYLIGKVHYQKKKKKDKKEEGRQKEQGRLTVWDEAAEIVHSFEFSALREMNELV